MKDLYLYDAITTDSATKIHNEILGAEMDGENEITININSVGGSIFAGWSIISTMLSKQNAGMIINTHVSGIGGSMGGVVAMFGNNVSMNDFALLMIHNPSFGGQQPTNPAERIVIDKIKNSLITIFSGRRGMDKNTIANVMSAETWFDSSDAMEFGLVDNIVNTGTAIQIENKTFDYIYNMVNSLIVKTKPKTEMKEITNVLGIAETDNESVVVEAIENKIGAFETTIVEKDGQIVELTNSITEMTEKLTNNDALIVELKTKIAEIVVNEAIANGKIDATSKNVWVEMAVNDMEKTVGLIASFKSQPANIINQLVVDKTEEKKMTFKEMSKNDPKGLQNLMNNDWEKYSNLYKEQYGVAPAK